MGIYRKRSSSVEKQIASMKSLYPQFRVAKRKNTEVEFIGVLQPKREFRKYKISVKYRGDSTPQVKVIEPKLVEKPPHFYSKSGTLCLYHPKDFKWSGNRLIAKHILPITSAWLYFYEVWLETNIWYGPEADHNDNDKISKNG